MNKITENWVDLGNVTDCVYSFEDEIIPSDKINNRTILWLKLDGQVYAFKRRLDERLIINELLGEKVSEYFGIDTVHHELATCVLYGKRTYGLLSPMARKENASYTYFWKELTEKTKIRPPYNMIKILSKTDEVFKKEPICKEIRSLIVRDFFTNEYDRVTSEILIEKEKSIHLGYLSDYELEFGLPFEAYTWDTTSILALDYETIPFIEQDEELMKKFHLALKCNLLHLLEELEEEKKLRISDEKKEDIKKFTSIRLKCCCIFKNYD